MAKWLTTNHEWEFVETKTIEEELEIRRQIRAMTEIAAGIRLNS